MCKTFMHPCIRQGLMKKFNGWQKYPQFHVGGELVSRLDIAQELVGEW